MYLKVGCNSRRGQIRSTHSPRLTWWWRQRCPCGCWRCRCTLQSPGAPRWAAPGCCSLSYVSTAEESAAWTRWWSERGILNWQIGGNNLSWTATDVKVSHNCMNETFSSLPWASQRSIAVSPSTMTSSGSGTEARGTVGSCEPPSTMTSTLVSVVPSLLRAVQTYMPLSSGRATRIYTRGENTQVVAHLQNRTELIKKGVSEPAWLHWTPWARGCSAWSCGCCPACARTQTGGALRTPGTPG